MILLRAGAGLARREIFERIVMEMETIFGIAVIILCFWIIRQDIKMNRLDDKRVILIAAVNRAKHRLRDQEHKGEGDPWVAFVILDGDEVMDAQDMSRTYPKYSKEDENESKRNTTK